MSQKYGYLANAEDFERNRACLICDDPAPNYSWTDYHGEGYCLRCGTPYQLVGGTLEAGESYPSLNVGAHAVPALRRFWQETGKPNGCGHFLVERDYPDQLAGRRALNAWWQAHRSEYPECEPNEQSKTQANV